MKELTIQKNESGQRLDKFLAKYLNRAPKSFLYKMMRKKNITLNGKKAAGNERLALGDTVKLFLSDGTIEKFTAGQRTAVEQKFTGRQKAAVGQKFTGIGKRAAGHKSERPDILYEDSHVIFINKPAGMLSQKAGPEDFSLVEYLTGYLLETGAVTGEELRAFRPAVCNRLDRNTSGIVAAGKTLAALQQLSEMFHDRTVGKYYLCLVKGTVTEQKHICGQLLKDRRTNKVSVTAGQDRGGGKAEKAVFIETEYRPIKSAGGTTLLEVHLITGKTHQIRAHLAAVGHPLAGDHKYGDPSFNDRLKKKYGLSSQLLHAYRLCMPKLADMPGEELSALAGMEIIAPLPELFETICKDRGVM